MLLPLVLQLQRPTGILPVGRSGSRLLSMVTPSLVLVAASRLQWRLQQAQISQALTAYNDAFALELANRLVELEPGTRTLAAQYLGITPPAAAAATPASVTAAVRSDSPKLPARVVPQSRSNLLPLHAHGVGAC